MPNRTRAVILSLFLIACISLQPMPLPGAQAASAPPIPPTPPAAQGPSVDPELQQQIEVSEETGYLIYFRHKADLSQAASMDWSQRGWYVMQALQQAAKASQAEVRLSLDAQSAEYQSFWIDNVIAVRSSNRAAFNKLLRQPEVESLRALRQIHIPEPQKAPAASLSPAAIEPNLAQVGADQAWALGYTGQGMVVANIDTGVRYTHAALQSHYRGYLGGSSFNHNYSWWDPYGGYTSAPGDYNGHGSHTMGIMVGNDGSANQTGMAPGARWIACAACNSNTCSDTALLECAEFVTAPWDLNKANPDPDKRPVVVNNSWGDCAQSYDSWFRGVVDAWQAAGIYPVFSAGNASNCGYAEPPGLNTVGNPARYGNVTAVGSSTRDTGQYASHSNWGPGDNLDTINPNPDSSFGQHLKPQVVAPGVNIRSTVNTSDSAYEAWAGTSMSAPHVSGLVALVLQAAPCLVGDYAGVETLIENTAQPIAYNTGGSPAPPPGNAINYATGHGEIDALAAVQAASSKCAPPATLEGQVTQAGTGTPITGAAVKAASHTTYQTLTDQQGNYVLSLPSGVYTVTYSAYGYLDSTTPGLSIANTLTRNVALSPAPRYTLQGKVTDANGGYGLYSHLTIDGEPGASLWSDPFSGHYQVELPAGVTLTLHAVPVVPGYPTATVTLPPLTGSLVQDFSLQPDPVTCLAPGYRRMGLSENFDSLTPPALPTGWAVSGGGGGSGDWATHLGTSHPFDELAHSLHNVVFFNSYTAPAGDVLRLYYTGPLNFTTLSSPLISLWMYHDPEYIDDDRLQVQVSLNDGATWDNAGSAIYRYRSSSGWLQHTVDLSAYQDETQVLIGFLGVSDYGNDLNLDDIQVGGSGGNCAYQGGGLAAGWVTDANTGLELAGAGVSNDSGESAITLAAPGDPAAAGGFYALGSPTGTRLLTATLEGGYQPISQTALILTGETVEQDFALPAGQLEASARGLSASLLQGTAADLSLVISNTGGAGLSWVVSGTQALQSALAPAAFPLVDWLSAAPLSGSLPAGPGSQQALQIHLDAGAPGVTQPGVYHAWLHLGADTPYPSLALPVTLTVSSLASMGRLAGLVDTLGRCEAGPAVPLDQVKIAILSRSGAAAETSSAADGSYAYALTSEDAPYQVQVSAAGYLTQSYDNIPISAGMTTTLDARLRLLQPCVSAAPASLAPSVVQGHSLSLSLAVSNLGAAATPYNLSGISPGTAAAGIPWVQALPSSGVLDSGGQADIQVTFTALPTMTVGQVYTGTLLLSTADPQIYLPLQMTVLDAFRLQLPLIQHR